MKISLISEMTGIGRYNKRTLVEFAEIRNLFAHRHDVSTLKDCYKIHRSNNKKCLLHEYLCERPASERNLAEAFNSLYENVMHIVSDLFLVTRRRVHERNTNRELVILFCQLMDFLRQETKSDQANRSILEEVLLKSFEEFESNYNPKILVSWNKLKHLRNSPSAASAFATLPEQIYSKAYIGSDPSRNS